MVKKLKIINLIIFIPFLFACESLKKLTDGNGNAMPAYNKSITILVSGQSNGLSGVQGNIDKPISTTGKVHILNEPVGMSDFVVPIDGNTLTHSVSWVFLGDRISNLTGGDVNIVNVSFGNTSTKNWQQYIPILKSNIERHNPDFVIWIQGESDYIENIDKSDSYNYLKNIINSSRESKKNLTWFLALDSFSDNSNPYIWDFTNARWGQLKLILEGLAHRGPDIDKLRHTNWSWFEPVSHNSKAGAEFYGEGLIVHASEWFQILAASGILTARN